MRRVSNGVSAVEAVFYQTWTQVMSGKSHLDSALSRIQGVREKDAVAQTLSLVLRKPSSVLRAVGVKTESGWIWKEQKPERLVTDSRFREGIQGLLSLYLSGKPLPNPDAEEGDYPPELLRSWKESWGALVTSNLVRSLGESPGITVRWRRSAISQVQAWVDETFQETQVRFEKGRVSPLAFGSRTFARILHSDAYKRGDFEIQDEGSQLLAMIALDPLAFHRPGFVAPRPTEIIEPYGSDVLKVLSPMTVVDACAGAGGKTLAMADALNGRGRVFSYDVAPPKLKALSSRVSRTGMRNVKAVLLEEGSESDSLKKFSQSADRVLVDAPCSGMGVLRKCPDIKWSNRGESAFHSLEQLQRRLLSTYAALVRPDGFLTYSTCTFRREETFDVVEEFLATNSEFESLYAGYIGPGGLSDFGSDGFFVATFRRRACE